MNEEVFGQVDTDRFPSLDDVKVKTTDRGLTSHPNSAILKCSNRCTQLEIKVKAGSDYRENILPVLSDAGSILARSDLIEHSPKGSIEKAKVGGHIYEPESENIQYIKLVGESYDRIDVSRALDKMANDIISRKFKDGPR